MIGLYWRETASLCVQLASSRDLLQFTRPLQTSDLCTQTPSPQSYCDVMSHPLDAAYIQSTHVDTDRISVRINSFYTFVMQLSISRPIRSSTCMLTIYKSFTLSVQHKSIPSFWKSMIPDYTLQAPSGLTSQITGLFIRFYTYFTL